MVTAMHSLGALSLLFALADTVSGRVTDRAGAPLPGASVLVSELHRVATTGTDGAFVLADLPSGQYTVIVRHVGFAPVAREVVIRGATTLALALERAPLWLEPVTITATRAPIPTLASPLATAALSEDALRREQSVSLAHSLSRLPGIHALSTGAQIGKPVIRGLAGARVLVLADGSRLEDYSWSDEDGPSVDSRLAQRVEVIRGPVSVLYGSDALGGVVNVIPAELPDANGGPRLIRTGFEVSGATNNAEVAASARIEGASGPWGWRVFGIGRVAGSLHTPAGELDNTGFGAVNGEAVVGRRGARGSASLRYTRYAGEFKLLEANQPPSGAAAGGPERRLSDDRIQLAADHLLGSLRLETKAQWQRHSLVEISDTGTGPGGAPLEGTAFDLLLNTGTLDLLAHHAAGRSAIRGTVGLSGIYQTNDTRGPIALVPDARVHSAAGFVFEQATLGRWSVLAGGRVDLRRLTADSNTALALSPQRRHYTAWSGDVGLVYRPVAALAVSGNVGRAWRAPTLFELFSNGPHLGEARYEIGRADLVPEGATNVDVSARWQANRVAAEVAAYRNAIAHYVFITPTNQFKDTLRIYRYDQADALLTGAEVSVGVAVATPLSLHGRFDAVRGTNRATQQPLPLVPPARVVVGAELHGTGLRWADRVRLAVEGELVTRQTRLNPLDLPTAGYALLNVATGLERPLWGRAIRLDVAARNLGNTAYRSFLSRYKEFALDPGRNVVLRVSLGE
jgi:iron complex outermembrane recepter protein